MDRRDVRKLLRSRFVLFSCEGTAEGAVMQRLYDEDALVVPRERVVVDPMMFTPYTRQRKADSIARTFFANSYEGYGASGLLIARIVDSRAGRFVLPRRWNKNVAVESFFTRPEIEMLVSRKRGCARMRVAKLNGPSSMVLPSCGLFSAEVGRPRPLSACKGEAP